MDSEKIEMDAEDDDILRGFEEKVEEFDEKVYEFLDDINESRYDDDGEKK